MSITLSDGPGNSSDKIRPIVKEITNEVRIDIFIGAVIIVIVMVVAWVNLQLEIRDVCSCDPILIEDSREEM